MLRLMTTFAIEFRRWRSLRTFTTRTLKLRGKTRPLRSRTTVATMHVATRAIIHGTFKMRRATGTGTTLIPAAIQMLWTAVVAGSLLETRFRATELLARRRTKMLRALRTTAKSRLRMSLLHVRSSIMLMPITPSFSNMRLESFSTTRSCKLLRTMSLRLRMLLIASAIAMALRLMRSIRPPCVFAPTVVSHGRIHRPASSFLLRFASWAAAIRLCRMLATVGSGRIHRTTIAIALWLLAPLMIITIGRSLRTAKAIRLPRIVTTTAVLIRWIPRTAIAVTLRLIPSWAISITQTFHLRTILIAHVVFRTWRIVVTAFAFTQLAALRLRTIGRRIETRIVLRRALRRRRRVRLGWCSGLIRWFRLLGIQSANAESEGAAKPDERAGAGFHEVWLGGRE